ncbi:MAG: prepilin-type N-terminal cleavage/methylation domain-containing protein [Geminicoccaceae bacterium]|nr:prepilin-type N-terminal cleavage/methylation domain-containing protein [Geminicoccaceae bacterium]
MHAAPILPTSKGADTTVPAPVPAVLSDREERPTAAPAHAQAGFTLVELSIVLVIIGLIIGGVLKGQEMIQSARLKSMIAQVESYRAAHNTFRDKYGALPGDYRDGQAALGTPLGITWSTPACDGSANACDGDGILDGSQSSQENLLYWQQLAAADLITGIQLADAPVASFGQGMPSASVGGGFGTDYATIAGSTGHWLFHAQSPNSGNGVLDGDQAEAIDRKLDDGRPGTGWIRQTNAACLRGGGALAANSAYDPGGRLCRMAFEID